MLSFSLKDCIGSDFHLRLSALDDFPPRLRQHAVEIAAVERMTKPIARLTARATELNEYLSWLGGRGLRTLVRKQDVGERTFAQIAPQWRPPEKVALYQLFVATDWKPLCEINRYLRAEDYQGIGHALGYPSCCVKWAAETDSHDKDFSGRTRQANLVRAAIERSSSFHATTNCLARESQFTDIMPAALISHYPCSFDCIASRQLAESYMFCLEDMAPEVITPLNALLRCRMLWWSDVCWPLDWANELPGLIIGSKAPEPLLGSRFVPLSNSPLPSGSPPAGGTITSIDENCIRLCGAGRFFEIDLKAIGRPMCIEWS